MATPVGNLTVDEAHTEFSKLIDQITEQKKFVWKDQRQDKYK